MRSLTTPLALPPQGRAGVPGPSGDYGFIRYGEGVNLPPTDIVPGVEIPFLMADPVIVASRLTGPFAGHDFLADDGRLLARRVDDSYLLRLRISVTATTAGGTFEAGIYIEGNVSGLAGAAAICKQPLSEQAGDEERPELLLQVAPGAGFVANGARILLKCSVPAQLRNEALFITPLVAAP